MILWNIKNDFFDFVKPTSVKSLFYGDMAGRTCYSGDPNDKILGEMTLIIVECNDINAWRVDETDLEVIN